MRFTAAEKGKTTTISPRRQVELIVEHLGEP